VISGNPHTSKVLDLESYPPLDAHQEGPLLLTDRASPSGVLTEVPQGSQESVHGMPRMACP